MFLIMVEKAVGFGYTNERTPIAVAKDPEGVKSFLDEWVARCFVGYDGATALIACEVAAAKEYFDKPVPAFPAPITYLAHPSKDGRHWVLVPDLRLESRRHT